MSKLDILIAEASSFAASLDGVEAGVWMRVTRAEQRREQRRRRAAALGIAAVIGGLAGGVSTTPMVTHQGELAIFNPRVAPMALQLMGPVG